ncbi:DNA primase [candidate division TA06 bacterium]|nr:DNA primase [candidate division TA06 bacterium]
MNRLPQEKIMEVREATDIVALLSEYLPLKKAGRSFKSLCPFHEEKTPSFIVSPERQVYHCFGCGIGGNVFTFLVESEKISFPEAVRFLANRAGIPLPTYEPRERDEGLDRLYRVNELASKFYHDLLTREEGKTAREYFKNRGITEETIQTFRLGYAPSGWDRLLQWARKNSIPADDLHKAGLAIKREEGGFYDRFRERILFPIMNPSGRVVGFGGRVIREGNEPKYLNTPETPIYQKGKGLYGLYQTKTEIRKREKAILVEGYTDLLTLYQSGFRNVVASLGTALTPEQGRLLGRYTPRVLLLYDPDLAGKEAALRGGDLLLPQGLVVEVLSLEKGKDPALFLTEKGKEGFETFLKGSKEFIHFKLDHLQERYDAKREEEKIVREMAFTVGQISDPVRRRLYAERLGERLTLLPETLLQALPKSKTRGSHPKILKEKGIEEVEFRLIGLMRRNEKILQEVKTALTLEDFSSPMARGMIDKILKNPKEMDSATLLGLNLSHEARSELSEILFLEDESFNFYEEAKGCIGKIRSHGKDEKRKVIKIEMKNAQGEKLRVLEREYKKISEEMALIRKET